MSQHKSAPATGRYRFPSWIPVIAILWICIHAATAAAGTEAGIKAFKAGNHEKAFEELKPAAQSGDPEAQFYMAKLYGDGLAVEKSYEKAVEWLERAVDQGHVKATLGLGYLHSNGIGVSVAKEKAVELYREAAKAGDPVAQRNLGLMYGEGEAVERDYKQAVDWFRQATEQGDARSAREIGEIFYYGRGSYPLDYERAIRWYCRGAYLDDGGSQYALYGLYLQGLGVASDTLTAFTWAAFAAERGYPGGEQAWSRADSYLSGEQKARIDERVSSDDKPRKYCKK